MNLTEKVPLPYRELVSMFVEKLLSYYKNRVVSIALFGSIARGNFKETSDIDILVVMKNLPKSCFKRYKLISNILDEVEPIRMKLLRRGIFTGISPVILEVEEAKYFRPLYLDLAYDAIILYDKNNYLNNILKRMRELIEEFGGKRIWMGKRWLWYFEKKNPFIELCGVKLIA